MPGVIEPLVVEPIKHIHRLITQPNYFTYNWLVTRLRWKSRHVPFKTQIHGWDLRLPDAASFLSTYRSVFVDKLYAFSCGSSSPNVLDLGANTGLGVLFIKTLYPGAKITAFEPDPDIFEYLTYNIHGNGYSDVNLVNKAAWVENVSLPFLPDGADGGRIVIEENGTIIVQAIDLREILKDNEFDFVKMDIEGAETKVLSVCRDHLGSVKNIFVEFHSWEKKHQKFSDVITSLEDMGFCLVIRDEWSARFPLLRNEFHPDGYDFQANIFGWRE